MASPKKGINISIPTEALMMLLHPEISQGSTGPGAPHPDDYYYSHLGGNSGRGSGSAFSSTTGSSSQNLGTAPSSSFGSEATPNQTIGGMRTTPKTLLGR